MPFRPDDRALEAVRKVLPRAALKVWCESATKAEADGADHNGAVRAAWDAVGKRWRRPDVHGGRWVIKDAPTQGAVHVDAPLGSERKKKPAPSEKADAAASADMRPLYIHRPLENGEDLIAWAKGQGFATTLQAADLHVTVLYSKQAMDWSKVPEDFPEVEVVGGPRAVERLGDSGAVGLVFVSPALAQRHKQLLDLGGSSDFPTYRAHVTITWNAPADLDLSKVEPYRGDLRFGPEVMEPINDDWKAGVVEKRKRTDVTVAKVDASLGLVFGWAIVCKEADGSDYFDTQGDHIPEGTMIEAAADFMLKSRMAADMHARDENGDPVPDGDVVFAMPMTKEIAAAFGMTTEKTGLMIAMRPSPDTLAKYQSGEYTGFSIGGYRVKDQEV